MKRDKKLLLTALFINGLGILIYYHILRNLYVDDVVYHDPLNKQVFDMPIISKNCCSWWPICHFIVYALYSFIWPQYTRLLFIIGILWEGLEGIANILITPSGQDVKHQRTRKGGEVEYVTWWEASYKDILFNSVGIIVGKTLRGFW